MFFVTMFCMGLYGAIALSILILLTADLPARGQDRLARLTLRTGASFLWPLTLIVLGFCTVFLFLAGSGPKRTLAYTPLLSQRPH
ncbi:hypothetical protein [Roseibium sp.]|uniref:hypothetical protein n=1 Tax=Roseibium sp. TaxID=1936156 RepID=UPI003D0BB1FE